MCGANPGSDNRGREISSDLGYLLAPISPASPRPRLVTNRA